MVGGIESGQKFNSMFYVSSYGSILINVWTLNVQNEDLVDISYCMKEVTY